MVTELVPVSQLIDTIIHQKQFSIFSHLVNLMFPATFVQILQ